MAEIATVFGQPATSASLAPTFALPDDFRYPAGTVVGTFSVLDRDIRTTDAIDIDEERIVDVDGANDVASFDAFADALAVDGKAGLPILDGGEVTYMREGRGLAEDFGRFAEDGHIELRVLYPIERYDDNAVFFTSGVIAAAGFQSEDTPFSNSDIRIDVSNGEWAGTVAVGDVNGNVNNEDVGHVLIWSLTRSA